MKNKALEAWAWVLIYGGLLLVMLGFYLTGSSGALVCKVLGFLVALAGALMVFVRARRPNDGN